MRQEEPGVVSTRALLPTEIPNIIEKLEVFAHINVSYSEFKDMVSGQKVFKIMHNSDPFGVAAISKEVLPKIKIWLSERESKESWNEAIKLIINQAFIPREVNILIWEIAKNHKEIISCANSCGFENIGELLNRGPNGETIIIFELSKASMNGNSAKHSPSDKALIEAKKIIENLQNSLLETDKQKNIAKNQTLLLEEKNEKLRQEIAAFKKQLDELGSKLIKVEDSKEYNEAETIKALKEKIAELEAIIEQQNKESVEALKLLGEKTQKINELEKTIAELKSSLEQKKTTDNNSPDQLNSRNSKLEKFLKEKSTEQGKKWQIPKIQKLAEIINSWLNNPETIMTVEKIMEEFKCSMQTPVNWMNGLDSIGLVNINRETKLMTFQLIKEAIPPEIMATKIASPNTETDLNNIKDENKTGLVPVIKIEPIQEPKNEEKNKIIENNDAENKKPKLSLEEKMTAALKEQAKATEPFQKKEEVKPLSDYDKMVLSLRKYGPEGVNGNELCKEAHNTKAIPLGVAQAILHNLEKQKMLTFVARANNVLNSKIALKQEAETKY